MRVLWGIAAAAALVACGGVIDDRDATRAVSAGVIGTADQRDGGGELASPYGAAARCEDAPVVPLGGTVVTDTCSGTTIPAAICWSAQSRMFFRVDAPAGTRLRFDSRSDLGRPQVSTWQECSNNSPRECPFPAVASFAVQSLIDARLFGVELFDAQGYPIAAGQHGCGTVSVTVTADSSKP